MLTPIKDLPQYLLTKNAAELKFLKRGIFSAGGYAEYFFEPDLSTFIDGNVWEIEWGSNVHSITLTAGATTEPDEMPESSGTPEDYLNDVVVPALRAMVALHTDFFIEAISYAGATRHYIRFRAREKGSAYSITLGAGTTVTFTSDVSTAGVDAVKADDYKVKLQVMVEREPGMNDFEAVKTLEATGEANETLNEMEISFYDIPALLRRWYTVKPPADVYSILKRDVLLRKFKYGYYEYAGGASGRLHQGEEKYILHGGVDVEHADFAESIGSKYFLQNSQIQFLTNQPRTKIISREQPEWLLFFVSDFVGYTMAIRTVATFDDASTSTIDVNVEDEWRGNLLLIPAGVKQLQLEALETGGKTLTHYTVQIMKTIVSASAASEAMKYIVDVRTVRDEKFLVFENSFGGLDTLRITGASEWMVETEQEVTEGIASQSLAMTESGTQSMVGKFDQDKWKMNTGHLRESDLLWMNDFIRSPFVWEAGAIPDYDEDLTNSYAMRYKRMIVTSKKYELDETSAFRWAMDIEAQYAWEDNNVTRGSVTDNLLTDDYIEFVIHNPEAGDIDVTIGSNADITNVEMRINGEVLPWTGNSETVTILAGTTRHFIIKAKNMREIAFTPVSPDLEITWKHLSFYNLEHFICEGFVNIDGAFFIDKLRYARKLEIFTHSETGSAQATDALLRELAIARASFGLLTDVIVEGVAPSAAGDMDVDYLTGEGVSVTVT